MARDHKNVLIDPFNGQQDIEARLLRHVSPAFTEDPVRVLRIAKFMARFSHLGFEIADTTQQLMQSMVDSGEIDNLVPERVWRECEASMAAISPRAFFTSLLSANALAPNMPELDEALRRHAHTKADNAAGQQSTLHFPMLDALDTACKLSNSASVRFAALCAGFTTEHAASLARFCERLRVPAKFADLAMLSAHHTTKSHQAFALDAAVSIEDYPQAVHLRACAKAMGNIDAAQIAKSQPSKTTISSAIKQHEIDSIETCLNAN